MKPSPLIIVTIIFLAIIFQLYFTSRHTRVPVPSLPTPVIHLSLTPPPLTPSPTPTPLSFKTLSLLYGPCVNLPILMYHHVQPESQAKLNGQTSLTVDTPIFQKQIEYLVAKKYNSITPQDLVNYFDHQTPLPSKPILLTFDDAYSDFATDAAPLLKQSGLKATVFVPTGLVDNLHYLTWTNIHDLSSTGLFTFANHTWSHHSLSDSLPVITKELTLSSTQLKDHSLTPDIFAYPYGTVGKTVLKYLADNAYKLAFTTHHGWTMCSGQRLQLPRIRVGNAPLSSFGL